MNVIVIAVILFTIIGVCAYVYSKQSSTPSLTPPVIQTNATPTPYSSTPTTAAPKTTAAPTTAAPTTAAPTTAAPTTAAPTTAAPTTAAPTTAAPKTTAAPTPSATPFFPTYTPAPKINCAVSDWADTSACSATCNSTGTKNQKRTVTTQAANGGDACPALEQSISCTNTTPCPVDCVMNDWTDTSTCTGSCGGGAGTKNQSRTVKTPASNGGKCYASLTQTISCTNTTPCPKVDCVVSGWSDTTTCTGRCSNGVGTKNQSRTVITQAANDGSACPALTQTISCTNTTPCAPINCVQSDWADDPDTPCSVTSCGQSGTKDQIRKVTTQPKYNGTACGDDRKSVPCSTVPCPIDCAVDWNGWGPCSATTGQGTQTKTFNIRTQPQYQGAGCPAIQTQSCCAPGWVGSSCQFSNATTCNNHGSVDANGNCSCNDGYGGSNCQYSNASNCSNQGSVNADGSCSCSNYTSNSDGQSKAYLGANCQLSDNVQCGGDGSVVAANGYCSFIINSGDIIRIRTPDRRYLKGANNGHQGDFVWSSAITAGPDANSEFMFIGSATRGALRFSGGQFSGQYLTTQRDQSSSCCGGLGGAGNFDCNRHRVLTIKSFGRFSDADYITFVPNGDGRTFKIGSSIFTNNGDGYLGVESVCERHGDGSLCQDGYNWPSHQIAGFGTGRQAFPGGLDFYLEKKAKNGQFQTAYQVNGDVQVPGVTF